MNIVLVHSKKVPVLRYGGAERVFWDLTKALVGLTSGSPSRGLAWTH